MTNITLSQIMATLCQYKLCPSLTSTSANSIKHSIPKTFTNDNSKQEHPLNELMYQRCVKCLLLVNNEEPCVRCKAQSTKNKKAIQRKTAS